MRYVIRDGVPTKYVRPTSIKSYEEIVETGWLGKAQVMVFEYLYHNGPVTGAEGDHRTHSVGGHFHKRLSELRDMGVVEEVGTTKCSVTGRDAVLWDVTGRAPAGPYKRVSKKENRIQELEERVAQLEAENQQLKDELQRRNHHATGSSDLDRRPDRGGEVNHHREIGRLVGVPGIARAR